MDSDLNQSITTNDESTSSQPAQVEELQQLEALIGRKTLQLDELKEKLRNFREQMKNIVDNDEQLNQATQTAQEAVKAITKRKGEVRNLPEAKAAKNQMAEVQTEIKELEESLNTHLVNLYQLTGTKEFKTLAGETREFKLLAKLLPKKKE
ncbi:hypothetical protein A2160_03105 [Candidatus Beckwithbacteria bacterium RBG_13_42_9]|uniref:Uncharacterized protein n=1 Tax=Candidatus Beckwithbacteria bacterium RBG_13_42_9 TaxID=1797457 RepID=A0A1F5E7P8_9BACT|nr:MAG: hypothetical protein A2160_03105 [Candidatus Beckwithbacteria bacterium RBG_13_42_9]